MRGGRLFIIPDPCLDFIKNSHKDVIAGTSPQYRLLQRSAVTYWVSNPFRWNPLAFGPLRVLESSYSPLAADP
jgi:hypothetical protein